MPPHEEPILFLWSLSAWAAKITAYLALRRIPHARCEQPITQPRPDLDALGVNYRRIPVLSIGRDIYCDTLLILEKLEEVYGPEGESGYPSISARQRAAGKAAVDGNQYALERLWEKWTDTVVFKAAAAAIPTDLDLMKDPAFQKDREELWGRSWGKAEQDALRPKGLADLRADFDLLETTLSDGREWITASEAPVLADIHACWIFDWLFLLSAYDEKFFNQHTFPKTWAWRERYKAAVERAKEEAPTPTELSGPDAVAKIQGSGFQESDEGLRVEDDPEGWKEGDEVEMWPVDTGFGRKDAGRLARLSVHEAAVRTHTQDGKEIRIHHPRWNFVIRKAAALNGEDGGESGKKDGEFVELN